ncbi:hypothetical protein [Methyloparacoccus murrellii]
MDTFLCQVLTGNKMVRGRGKIKHDPADAHETRPQKTGSPAAANRRAGACPPPNCATIPWSNNPVPNISETCA